jgi:hypothetical protein
MNIYRFFIVILIDISKFVPVIDVISKYLKIWGIMFFISNEGEDGFFYFLVEFNGERKMLSDTVSFFSKNHADLIAEELKDKYECLVVRHFDQLQSLLTVW